MRNINVVTFKVSENEVLEMKNTQVDRREGHDSHDKS